jgi:hypothetical protein
MALLGGVLLSVSSDNPDRQSTVTQHEIESGENIADHVSHMPYTLNISGVVVGPDAAARLTKLEDIQRKGMPVQYVNRVKYDNVVIQSFGSDHGVATRNGFLFNMTLVRVRTTQASPVQTMKLPQRVQAKTVTNKGRQQTVKAQPKVSATDARATFLTRKGLE